MGLVANFLTSASGYPLHRWVCLSTCFAAPFPKPLIRPKEVNESLNDSDQRRDARPKEDEVKKAYFRLVQIKPMDTKGPEENGQKARNNF
jgi:hypothetical protein